MSTNDDRIVSFMEMIERAWMENHDDSIVDRLAAEHPELAETLYLFFAAVVDAPDELERHRPELAQSAARTRDWLERAGFKRAAEAGLNRRSVETTPTPTRKVAESVTPTFIGLLRQITGADPRELAIELGITLDFLVEVSSNAAALPNKVRRELALRAHRARNIGMDLSLASLSAAAYVPRAASRKDAFSATPTSYLEIVINSKLSAADQLYWSSLGTAAAAQSKAGSHGRPARHR